MSYKDYQADLNKFILKLFEKLLKYKIHERNKNYWICDTDDCEYMVLTGKKFHNDILPKLFERDEYIPYLHEIWKRFIYFINSDIIEIESNTMIPMIKSPSGGYFRVYLFYDMHNDLHIDEEEIHSKINKLDPNIHGIYNDYPISAHKWYTTNNMILKTIQKEIYRFKNDQSKEDIKNYVNNVIKIIFDFEYEKMSNAGLHNIITEYLEINYNDIGEYDYQDHFEYTDLSQ